MSPKACQSRALWVSLALLLGGCSRASSDTAPPTPAPSAPGAPAPGAAAPSLATAPSLSSADPTSVPTPEDLEDDSAHRITDQNLESELDRLEREIQAE